MEFETARLRIRHLNHLNHSDVQFVLTLVNTEGFLKNIGDRGIRTLEQAKDTIAEKYAAGYPKYGLFAVELKETEQILGAVSYLKKDYLEANDVGYAFLPRHFGHGYAFEATEGLVKWATEQGETLLQAVVNKNNSPSRRLLENLHFEYVGDVTPPDEDTPICKYDLNIRN